MLIAVDEIPARLRTKPSWLLTQTAMHAHRLSADGFNEAGARGYHYRILASLAEFGVSSQADLGRRSHMDRSDVVAAINELAARGYVERTPDPGDRRRNLVTLTTAGDQQLQRIDQALDHTQDQLLAPLSPHDRQTLTRLLTQLMAHHQQDQTTRRSRRDLER